MTFSLKQILRKIINKMKPFSAKVRSSKTKAKNRSSESLENKSTEPLDNKKQTKTPTIKPSTTIVTRNVAKKQKQIDTNSTITTSPKVKITNRPSVKNYRSVKHVNKPKSISTTIPKKVNIPAQSKTPNLSSNDQSSLNKKMIKIQASTNLTPSSKNKESQLKTSPTSSQNSANINPNLFYKSPPESVFISTNSLIPTNVNKPKVNRSRDAPISKQNQLLSMKLNLFQSTNDDVSILPTVSDTPAQILPTAYLGIPQAMKLDQQTQTVMNMQDWIYMRDGLMDKICDQENEITNLKDQLKCLHQKLGSTIPRLNISTTNSSESIQIPRI